MKDFSNGGILKDDKGTRRDFTKNEAIEKRLKKRKERIQERLYKNKIPLIHNEIQAQPLREQELETSPKNSKRQRRNNTCQLNSTLKSTGKKQEVKVLPLQIPLEERL